jgi:hypothetical protein
MSSPIVINDVGPRDGVHFTSLIPNMKGYELALAAGGRSKAWLQHQLAKSKLMATGKRSHS